MKKFTAIICTFALCALLALSASGCVNVTVNYTGSSSSASATTSASASADGSSSKASTAGASSSAASSSFGANSNQNAGSYKPPDITVEENGEYTDKDSVALYIHTFGHVPSNYISKTKARAAGWVNTKGNLWDVLPGKSIGGGGFNNDDKTLPDAPGREWFECDIDYEGGFRNAKRIVYSNDGLIFYTDDHYETFEQLY